jgi:enoyl-CoA hydratase/carnithine racemase
VTSGLLLYQLHDRARDEGLQGYRRMSKTDLEVALGLAEPPGPTAVEVDVRGGLGLLTLRGESGGNALSLEALEALADEAERLAADEAVRVVAIIGEGDRVFSSGADLAAVRGVTGAEVTARGTAACERIATLGVPTLALLNGHAVGGAIDLALACDWRIAAQGAKLRFIHNELGYCPPWGGAQRLARLIPAGTALRLFATCELLSVDEARQLGIVDAVVSRDRLLGRAEALVVRVARAGREAVTITKQLLGRTVTIDAHQSPFAALWDARSAGGDGAG